MSSWENEWFDALDRAKRAAELQRKAHRKFSNQLAHWERNVLKRKSRKKITPKKNRPKCGAKTRAGGRCKAPAVWDKLRDQPRVPNARCRLHGGLTPKWHEIGRTHLRHKVRRD